MNYARMVKEYKNETATTNDYNGRQLLELIQNADDAESDIISISLDKENRTLSISNNGEPFIAEGYRSLMLPGLSSKIKKTFIGNKGLGFRSIISWAESVKINGNNLSVEFSNEISKKTYLNLFDEDTRTKIRNEFSFPEITIPLPFLAIPEITDYSDGNFITTIEIKYRNKEQIFNDIIKQVKELKSEVLLFLNNINHIHFEGFDNDVEDIKTNETKKVEKPIRIANKEWRVYEKIGELDKEYQDENSTEKEFYQVKIAIPQNFANNIDVLYTFFPTKVNLEFPFVVHGTFDLDSSRNQLIKSNKNKFVLEILIELIVETAKKVSLNKTSWEPIKLLKYSTKNKVLEELGFYDLINNKIKELALYPCIDGNYRKINDTIIYCNEFSDFIIENNHSKIFEKLLLPIDKELREWIQNKGINFYALKQNYLVKNIDLLSSKLKTINERVDFVYILIKNPEFNSKNQRYSILINEEKKIINKDISIFTPPTTKSEKFDVPDFIKIDFLNKDFYRKLLNKFNLQNTEKKARELQRVLKDITNISSFEPSQIINKIIIEANRKIKTLNDKKKTNEVIRKMIKSLYLNYQDLKETTRPDTSKVQIITKSGKAHGASNLYLSADYPSGKITEDIFSDVFPKNYFIASKKTLGLSQENDYEVERFLVDFFNINILTKFKSDIRPEYEYERFVFENIKKPRDFRSANVTASKIENIDVIFKEISIEKLLLLLLKDEKLFRQLNNNFNNDIFKYDNANERNGYFSHTLSPKPSYIKYQIITKSPFDFSSIFINNEKLSFINDIKIDYTHLLFKKYNITEDDINNLLLELGAKENFEDFTIERISKIITELKEKDPLGKNAQKIYKLAFEHFRKHKLNLILNENTTLFSKKGDKLDYFPIDEVYYTDNITLPQKIINQHPILYFPKRSGEEQVSQFFDIKTFKDYKLEIEQVEINEDLSKELDEYLTDIKPYLLTIRLNEIKSDNQRQINRESNYINNLDIKVCYSINCIIDNNEIELDDFDFIKSENKFYVRLNSISNIQELKKDSVFSDIISEIITITFRVNENQTDFRTCFRNEIEDTEHQIIAEYGEELLQEAKELLNMSDYQRNFWGTIFSIKGKELNSKGNLNKQITENLNIDISSIINIIDYQFLSISNNVPHLTSIFQKLNITIGEFNNKSAKKIDLTKHHSEVLKNYFYTNERRFKIQLWEKLNNDKLNQDSFLDLLSKYEKSDYFINNISVENKFNFSFNIEGSFKFYIKREFNIEVRGVINEMDLSLLYKNNKSEFTPKEQDKIEENTKLKSLLYFNNTKEKIIELLKLNNENEVTINNTEEDNGNKSKAYIVDNFTVKAKEIKSGSKKNGVYTPNSETNKINKKKGLKSENKVYSTLLELYGKDNVSWKSKEDEGLHYDIRYTKDGTNWIYVEVKSFESGRFYISNSEKSFGEKYKDKYEVWLVNYDELYPIKLFQIKDFNIEATEFIVSLEIEKNE